MEDNENMWVFESLICFLNGPVWNAPLQSFIEEKSLIFDVNVSENPEYHKIFDEYRNLVDLMLGSYMEDIGITPMQFEEACNKGHLEFESKHFEHTLFEQIWAANDYEMFKRMMGQRNIELQLQALELIEQKYGITPQSFIPHKEQPHSSSGDSVIKTSQNHDLEEEIMEEVVKQFPYDDDDEKATVKQEPGEIDEEVQYLLEEKHILQETLKNIGMDTNEKQQLGLKQKDISEVSKAQNDSLGIKSKQEKSEIKEVGMPTKDEIAFDKKPMSNEIDRIELKKRQEYLRAQRDKLVALKKEARKKQLDVDNVNSAQDKMKSRPKSAKVAQAVLAGNPTKVDHQQLQVRKALAERLRSEVINSKDEN